MPYISSCYLINGTVLSNAELKPDYAHRGLDYDMAFCADMRTKVIFFDFLSLKKTCQILQKNLRFSWQRIYLF